MTSKRKRLEIERKASLMILSDEETQNIYSNYYRRKYFYENLSCLVCKQENVQLNSFFQCSSHRICAQCLEHAKICEIHSCTFCPAPPINFHLQCTHCQYTYYTNDLIENECPKCQKEFPIRLLRIWKRGLNTYTNFLTEEEKQILRSQFFDYPGKIFCPSCRIPLERSTACNEIHHCGPEKVCNACGQMSFRWEMGLHQHRKQSHCANMIHEDTEALEYGEYTMIHKRLEKEYKQCGIL